MITVLVEIIDGNVLNRVRVYQSRARAYEKAVQIAKANEVPEHSIAKATSDLIFSDNEHQVMIRDVEVE